MKLILVLASLSTVLAAVIPELQQAIVKDETHYHDALPDDDLCIQTNGEGHHENNTLRIATFKDPKNLGVDPGSQQYSGYLNLPKEDRQLFFWMFMSRRGPANDPVVLWLNGGPGCSSLYGALTQWGPKLVDENGRLVVNQHTLIEKATFIFLDQPVGVGFSWSGKASDSVTTTRDATADVMKFLALFFETNFKLGGGTINFRDNQFHVAGESFAGHYVPNIARAVLEENKKPNAVPIKLTSIIIGNGFIDALLVPKAICQMVCDGNLTPDSKWLISKAECKAVQENHLPQCKKMIQKCRDNLSQCQYVSTECRDSSAQTLAKILGCDPYDLSKKRAEGAPRNDVEKDGGTLENFLQNSRDALGVTLPLHTSWKTCRDNMVTNFYESGDHSKNYVPDLEALLATREVRILLYAGDTDLMVPFLSVKETAKSIKWDGQDIFNQIADRLESKYSQLKDAAGVYGNYVSLWRLMYARIYGAGHMVNENKAPQAKDLFYTWLFDEKKFMNLEFEAKPEC